MKWKTAAFLILLVFMANIFATTLTIPVAASEDPTPDTFDFGGSFVPCDDPPGGGDPVPGGPGPGGDGD